MKTMTTSELKSDIESLAREAAEAPVTLIGANNDRVVVMSERQYARLRGEAWARLFSTMDRMAAEAHASGMTEERLEELLADES